MYHKYSQIFDNSSLIQNNAGFVDYGTLPVNNQVFYVAPQENSAMDPPDIPSPVVNSEPTTEPTTQPTTEPTTQPMRSEPTLQGSGKVMDGKMLPVLDTQFNLREICKQCILCEDHLSHQEKMCRDCIMKHLLALEGLAEEAITLDKDSKYPDIVSLPSDFRDIQRFWFSGEKTPHECSQALRKIRKKLMETTFPVIFEASCSTGACMTK
ncbi:MAG: hypothetical protein CMM15_07505 [Rhodospirillaceae bacterium]|nr:hypothetical protein [Rhodospirillaceae bacterium]|tara:strand:- start:67 stop:696 length:630 start_codon:yes stop_codon:yes gene_type:complete